MLAQAPTTSWPTYHGDNTGRRFSPLTRINDKNLSGLATGMDLPHRYQGQPQVHAAHGRWHSVSHGAGPRMGRRRPQWQRDLATRLSKQKAVGTSATAAWHSGNWLFFLTPDCQIISLNLKDGSERWRKQNCDLDQFYYGSMAPMIVKNRVIAGVSATHLDRPGYLTAYDPGPVTRSGAGR